MGATYHPNCCRTILMDVQPIFYPIGNTKTVSVCRNPDGEEEFRMCTHIHLSANAPYLHGGTFLLQFMHIILGPQHSMALPDAFNRCA